MGGATVASRARDVPVRRPARVARVGVRAARGDSGCPVCSTRSVGRARRTLRVVERDRRRSRAAQRPPSWSSPGDSACPWRPLVEPRLGPTEDHRHCAAAIFGEPAGAPGWATIPSYYAVSRLDRTIAPRARAVARGAYARDDHRGLGEPRLAHQPSARDRRADRARGESTVGSEVAQTGAQSLDGEPDDLADQLGSSGRQLVDRAGGGGRQIARSGVRLEGLGE